MTLNRLKKLRKFEINKCGKCKCLHTGPRNTGMNDEMGGTILSKTMKEKDLDLSRGNNECYHESRRTLQNCTV